MICFKCIRVIRAVNCLVVKLQTPLTLIPLMWRIG